MLTNEVLETQTAVELPAREMLAIFNYSRVTVLQGNLNAQLGAVNISGGQSNNALVFVYQH